MPKPSRRLLNPPNPWTPGIIPEWDVLSTKQALLAHEQGQFRSSSIMATAMGRDDRITAVIETRVKGLLSLPFQMLPAEVPNKRRKVAARKIAESIEAHWLRIAPPGEVSNAMWWFILLGVAPIQITWSTIEGVWVPTMRAWDPQYMYWYQPEGVFKMQTTAGEVDVLPENGWMVLVQGDRGWMRGAIRPISPHWLSRQWVIRDWNRYNERHGLPIVKAMVPSRAAAPEKDSFFRNVSQIGSTATALLPQGIEGEGDSFDLELLEAKDQAWKSFEGLESSANKNIAVNILGQNLTTEVGSGSLAAANIHNLIRLDRLEGDAELLASAIRAQMLTPMVQFNEGEGARMLVPTPHWDTSPPADLVARGTSMVQLGEGLAKLQLAGFDVAPESLEELGQEFNLELVERDDDDETEEGPNEAEEGEEDELAEERQEDVAS